jgi:hypothetical protein
LSTARKWSLVFMIESAQLHPGMTAVWFGGTGDLSRSTADLNAPAWADLVSLFRDAEIEPTIPHR